MSFVRTGQVTDEYDRLVPGASIYVYKEDGTAAVVTSDGTTPLEQPIPTDEFGAYSYYVAAAGVYREDTWFGAKLRFKEVVPIGLDGLYPPSPRGGLIFGFDADENPVAVNAGGADSALRTDLAAETGSLLILHKSSLSGTFGRSLRQWALVGGAEDRNVMNWIDSDLDPGLFARTDTTDLATAFQAAINHGPTFAPNATFHVNGTVYMPDVSPLWGVGPRKTIIHSDIPGGSLFTTNATVNFPGIANMTLEGNNVEDDILGSGHAIDLIDNNMSDGTFAPQQGLIWRVECRNFLGRGRANTAGDRKIAAAGIICVNGLQNDFAEVYVANCGHGFYFDTTQNCKGRNLGGTNCRKAVLAETNNIELSIIQSDLVNGGMSGSTDTGYAVPMGAGTVLSYGSQGTSFLNTKIKNYVGDALIVINQSTVIFTDGCSLRGDSQVDGVPNKTMLIGAGSNVTITGKTVFNPATTAFPTQPYQQIEVNATQTAPAIVLNVDDVEFRDCSSQNIDYNIYVHGNASVRAVKLHLGKIRFGSSASISGSCTVAADVKFDTITLVPGSELGRCTHLASTGVTRTVGISVGASVTMSNVPVYPSLFQSNGGTIVANYSGVAESFSPLPNIQTVASSSTVTPTFDNALVNITAQATNLTLANPTGTPVPDRSLTIRIKDNGTSRSIFYGTQYRPIGVTLPTATTISKTLYLTLRYNAVDTKWDVVGVNQEA